MAYQPPTDARSGTVSLPRIAIGNMGKSALASMVEAYGLFYCTEALRIDPRIAGLIILASLVWDALVDPFIGLWADRRLSRGFSFVWLFLIGMPLSAAAFLLFFAVHLLPVDLQIIAAVVVLIGYRAAYTLVDVPHNSLLVFAARHSADRTHLSSLRILFSALGKLCAMSAAAWWLSFPEIQAGAAMSGASIMVTMLFLSTVSLCAISVRQLPLAIAVGAKVWRPLTSLRTLFGTLSDLRLAFVLTALNSITIPLIGIALIYGAKYQIGNTEAGAGALILQAAMQAIMPVVWARLSNGARTVPHLLFLAYGALLAVTLLACLSPLSVLSLFLLAAGSGSAIAGIFMFNWVLFSDAIAKARTNETTDTTLAMFGLYSIVNKIGHGLAQAISGATIAMLMIPATPDSLASAQNMRLLPLLGIVALGALVSLILTHRFARNR